MANIGKMAVLLSAKTAAFNKGMKRSGKVVRRFAGGVASVGRKLISLGAVASVAAAAGLAIMTKRALASIDATKKLSDSIGISTRELTGFQLAAQIAGSSAESIAKGIQFFVKNLGEAKAGIGEARLNIEKLGLSMEGIIDATPSEAIKTFADRLQKIEDPARKAAIANALFGRAGKDLLIFFALGRKGLEALINENEAFGASFNEIDAAKVEEANDAVTRLVRIFKGLGQQIAINVSPFITDMVGRLKNLLLTGPSIGDIVGGAFDRVSLSIATAIGFIDLFKAAGLLMRATYVSIGIKIRESFLVVAKAISSTATFATQAVKIIAVSAIKELEILEVKAKVVTGLIGRGLGERIIKLTELIAAMDVREILESGTPQVVKDFFARREAALTALRISAERDIKEAVKLSLAFEEGAGFKKALAFIERMKKAGEDFAKSTAKGAGNLKGKPLFDPSKFERTAQFRQVRRGQIALGGPTGAARVQQVRDPEAVATLKVQVEILKKLLARSTGAVETLISRPASGI